VTWLSPIRHWLIVPDGHDSKPTGQRSIGRHHRTIGARITQVASYWDATCLPAQRALDRTRRVRWFAQPALLHRRFARVPAASNLSV